MFGYMDLEPRAEWALAALLAQPAAGDGEIDLAYTGHFVGGRPRVLSIERRKSECDRTTRRDLCEERYAVRRKRETYDPAVLSRRINRPQSSGKCRDDCSEFRGIGCRVDGAVLVERGRVHAIGRKNAGIGRYDLALNAARSRPRIRGADFDCTGVFERPRRNGVNLAIRDIQKRRGCAVEGQLNSGQLIGEAGCEIDLRLNSASGTEPLTEHADDFTGCDGPGIEAGGIAYKPTERLPRTCSARSV